MIGCHGISNEISLNELHNDITAELHILEDAGTAMSMPVKITNIPTPTCRVISTVNKFQNNINHTVIPKQSLTNVDSFSFDYSLKSLSFASVNDFFFFFLRHLII